MQERGLTRRHSAFAGRSCYPLSRTGSVSPVAHGESSPLQARPSAVAAGFRNCELYPPHEPALCGTSCFTHEGSTDKWLVSPAPFLSLGGGVLWGPLHHKWARALLTKRAMRALCRVSLCLPRQGISGPMPLTGVGPSPCPETRSAGGSITFLFPPGPHGPTYAFRFP